MEALVCCPYCGQENTVIVDESAGAQQYVEDCQVCCKPWQVIVTAGLDGELELDIRTIDQ
jgi:transposase-like protein